MRLARKKILDSLEPGQLLKLKKINEGEFLSYAKREIGLLFAEGVTEKSPEKFADILEIINNVCTVINIDFYECMKIKSEKRFSDGNYFEAIFSTEYVCDQEE